MHSIKEMIGHDVPINTIFISRIDTKRKAEIIREDHDTDEDYVTSRILWLDGAEEGINKGFRDSLRDSLPKLDCRRCNMAIILVFWLTNSGPNSAHQFIMAFCAIVESTVCFSKRICLLSSCDEETFGGKSRHNASFLSTSREITHRWSAHVTHKCLRVFNGRIHCSLE